MKQLKSIIEDYFPNETISKVTSIKLVDTWRTGISFGKFFYMKPLPMVETDKKIYFDKRVPMLYQSIISTFTGPIWLSLFLLIVQFISKINYPTIFFVIIIVGSIIIGIINVLINAFTLQNIFVIDKSWITNRKNENGVEVIDGSIPSGSNSYFFISFLSKEQRSELSFLDRFSGRMIFSANFNLRIEFQ